MKKRLIYFSVILFAVLMQKSVVPVLFGSSVVPDLVLTLVLAWTIRDGFADFLYWLIAAGIFYDLATFMPVGAHVLIFAVSSYALSFLARRFSVHVRGAGLFLLLGFILADTLFARLSIDMGEIFKEQNLKIMWTAFRPGFMVLWWEFVFNAMFVFGWLWLIKHIKKYFFI